MVGVSAMTAREAKHQYQLTEWAGRISERSKSGMTVRGWCAANHVNERVYHYWLRRVREYASQFLPPTKSLGAQFTPAAVPAEILEDIASPNLLPAAAPSGWAVCRPTQEETAPARGITIEIGKGRITATADTDPVLLGKVCRVLAEL